MNSFCVGSLIDPSHVLTAAHCVTSPDQPEAYTITTGRHNLGQPSGNEQTITAEQIFVHEQYNSETIMDDIAIIRLSRPVQISETANVICLPGPLANDEGDTVWIGT
jgi:secreted trypsin-like serine protease